MINASTAILTLLLLSVSSGRGFTPVLTCLAMTGIVAVLRMLWIWIAASSRVPHAC